MKKIFVIFALLLFFYVGFGQGSVGNRVARGDTTTVVSDSSWFVTTEIGETNVTRVIRLAPHLRKTFEDFGAVGDGVTDDQVAIEAALNSGKHIYAKAGAIYYIGDNLEIIGKNINITGVADNPATFLFKSNHQLKIRGVVDSQTDLKASNRANSQWIVVDDTDGFEVGNLFTVTTDSSQSWDVDTEDRDYRMGEIHEILGVATDTLFPEGKMWHSWNYDWITAGKIIRITEYIPITCKMSNMIITYETPQYVGGALYLAYSKDSYFDNVSVKDATHTGIMFHYCYNTRFTNGHVEGVNGAGVGYGLRFQMSSASVVDNTTFVKCFKGVEISTASGTYDFGLFPARNSTIRDNHANGNGYMADGVTLIWDVASRFVNTHGAAENLFVIDNTINNYHFGVLVSGVDLTAIGNKMNGDMRYGFSLTSGNNFVITNNSYQSGLFQEDTIGSPHTYEKTMQAFVVFSKNDVSPMGNAYIAGNHCNSSQGTFIGTSSATLVNNLTVLNNEVYFYNKDSAECKMYGAINYTNFIESGNIARSETSAIQYSADIESGEFVRNGDFATTQHWTLDEIWSIVDHRAYCDATTATSTSTSVILQGGTDLTQFPGDTFRVSFFVPEAAAGARIGIYSPGEAAYQVQYLTAGRYHSQLIVANATYPNVTMINWAVGSPFYMDNVSCVRISRERSNNHKSVYQDKTNYYIRGLKLNVNDMNVNLPTDSTALAPGDVWADGVFLKVKQ